MLMVKIHNLKWQFKILVKVLSKVPNHQKMNFYLHVNKNYKKQKKVNYFLVSDFVSLFTKKRWGLSGMWTEISNQMKYQPEKEKILT